MNKAVVIGKPISHSLSPAIFSFVARKLGVTGLQYNAEEVDAVELPHFVDEVRNSPAFVGMNVTIPHKEFIIAMLDRISPEAEAIGAVNVVQKKDSTLIGHNTDVYGILRTFEQNSIAIEGCRVFLFGAGGAARAVAYALGLRKAKLVEFYNTNRQRAQSLADKMTSIFPETKFRVVSSISECDLSQKIDLLINTTPLGMMGKPVTQDGIGATDYFSRIFNSSTGLSFSKTAVAFDLIYRPEQTPFLQLAQKNGLRTVGGLTMFVEQALQTWRIWFGSGSQVDQVSSQLTEYLRYRPIFLTGFMGAGKSTVGHLLAKNLGWNFLDMDSLIEKETQMPISQIFEKKGEDGFRELESQLVILNAYTPRTVISLGGGALARPLTRKVLEKSGLLVYLSAQPKTLLSRLESGDTRRPLLENLGSESLLSRVTGMLESREEHYSLAKLRIETDELDADQVVLELLRQIT